MLNINQDKRFWFIDLIAWWVGRISSSHLIKQFGISRTQAQNDIAYYQSLLSHNRQHHPSHKGFLLLSGVVRAYIHLRAKVINPAAQQLLLINNVAITSWLFAKKS